MTERITVADITVASILQVAYEILIDSTARPEYPNSVRFLNTIANNEKIKPSFGEIQWVEKALQFVPPVKEKKKETPSAAPKEKSAPKVKEETNDEDDEPLVPEEPKAKNPLDSLPKSTFNLEDWKRAYSNKDTRGADGALEWFYQKYVSSISFVLEHARLIVLSYDKGGFSIWKVDFKYNEELTLVFKSSNQITGFFSTSISFCLSYPLLNLNNFPDRLEGSRKYLFGSVGVLGEANNSIISGVFILRGTDYKPVVNVAPDWESYNYAPIDLADQTSKDFFEAALAWDLEVDGKKWADGKAVSFIVL